MLANECIRARVIARWRHDAVARAGISCKREGDETFGQRMGGVGRPAPNTERGWAGSGDPRPTLSADGRGREARA